MYIYIIYITFALIYCVNGVKCAWITELKKVAKTRKKIHARSGGGVATERHNSIALGD